MRYPLVAVLLLLLSLSLAAESVNPQMESVIKPAPWCEAGKEPKTLPPGWQKHTAQQEIVVDYLGNKVRISKGSTYFTFEGKVAIGWHGTHNPPCGM